MASLQESLVAAVGDGRGGGAAADRLCAACVRVLPVEAAAISLVSEGVALAPLGASGPWARVLDEVQFTLGEGPCLDAVAARAPVLVTDLAAEGRHRWLTYAAALQARGIVGVFALPVRAAGHYVGTLGLFRAVVGQWTSDQLQGALVAAELAALPLLDLVAVDLEAAVDDPDSDAWAQFNGLVRAEVAQATGMLANKFGVSVAEALVRLRAHACASGRSANEVAIDVVARRLRLDFS